MSNSNEKKPVLKIDIKTKLKWADEFDGDLSNWNQNTFVYDALNRTGNKYITKEGEIDMEQNWSEVPGRWAGLYDKHRDKCQFIRDGKLVMKGHGIKGTNYFRENFTDSQGVVHPYGEWWLYTSWLSTYARKRENGEWVGDSDRTHLTVSKGSVLEVRINLEKQMMAGHRWNFWLMPVTGDAYDEDVSDVEIDCPEVENPSRVYPEFGQRAMLGVIGGKAGSTPNVNIDLTKYGIDLRKGWHTFTTVWRHNGTIEFYVDGVLCNTEVRKVDMLAYVIMAREMNSGVKDVDGEDWENKTTGPKKPADPGLTGKSIILDVDMIEEDEVVIDYVRVYDIVLDSNPITPKISDSIYEFADGDDYVEANANATIKLLNDLINKSKK